MKRSFLIPLLPLLIPSALSALDADLPPLGLDHDLPPLENLYNLCDEVIGQDFYDFFNWEAIIDPTQGRVNYVDKSTSVNRNLTYASEDTFILRTDFTTTLSRNGPGRDSVRIISKKAYTQHVAVFDLRHMPQGCGTWPAIWETKGENWPSGGEIDILEGVNDQSPNAATLHTTQGCTMPAWRVQTGKSGQLDCYWKTNYNTGCGVKFNTPLSYGPQFNDAGGGWFAMERSTTEINVWFWSKLDPFVPPEIKYGAPFISPDPVRWGLPAANFPNTQCDFSKYFAEERIIINLTLCGDWAGTVYRWSGCPGTCVDYVNNNPSAFANAFFDFASIRVYEPASQSPPTTV